MEEIYLVKASDAYLTQIAEYRKEFLEAGSPMDGCGSLDRTDNPMGILYGLPNEEKVTQNKCYGSV